MRMSSQSLSSGDTSALEEPLEFPARGKTDSLRPAFKSSKEEETARELFMTLVFIVVLDALFRSMAKGLWFDEILTVLVSGQTHLSGTWDLLTHGVDGHPMGMYLIERVMGKLGGNERLIYRLPSIAAFLCVMVCMFSFVRRRAGGLVALISAGALLLTNVYDPFAFEARSYGVMIAFIALALMCYERADSKKWAVLLALSLMAATSMHFYAVLAFFPFGVAELTILITERRFRLPVWSAFVAGMLPYIVFWPILKAQRVLYGAHFWATPSFFNLAKALGELIHMRTSISFTAFTVTMIFLAIMIRTGNYRVRKTDGPGIGHSTIDFALSVGFFSMPIVTYVAARISHGGVSGRYLTVTDLGICLVLSLFLSRLQKPAIVFIGLFLLILFAYQEGTHWKDVLTPKKVKDLMAAPEQMSKDMNVPLVVSNGLIYLPVWRRANDELRSRIVFLADPQEQLAASGSDTTTLLLMTLKNYEPVNVQSFSEFAEKHRKFLIFSNGDSQDIWPRWLLEHGYSPRVVSIETPPKSDMEDGPDPPKAIVYLVDLDERK